MKSNDFYIDIVLEFIYDDKKQPTYQEVLDISKECSCFFSIDRNNDRILLSFKNHTTQKYMNKAITMIDRLDRKYTTMKSYYQIKMNKASLDKNVDMILLKSFNKRGNNQLYSKPNFKVKKVFDNYTRTYEDDKCIAFKFDYECEILVFKTLPDLKIPYISSRFVVKNSKTSTYKSCDTTKIPLTGFNEDSLDFVYDMITIVPEKINYGNQ